MGREAGKRRKIVFLQPPQQEPNFDSCFSREGRRFDLSTQSHQRLGTRRPRRTYVRSGIFARPPEQLLISAVAEKVRLGRAHSSRRPRCGRSRARRVLPTALFSSRCRSAPLCVSIRAERRGSCWTTAWIRKPAKLAVDAESKISVFTSSQWVVTLLVRRQQSLAPRIQCQSRSRYSGAPSGCSVGSTRRILEL